MAAARRREAGSPVSAATPGSPHCAPRPGSRFPAPSPPQGPLPGSLGTTGVGSGFFLRGPAPSWVPRKLWRVGMGKESVASLPRPPPWWPHVGLHRWALPFFRGNVVRRPLQQGHLGGFLHLPLEALCSSLGCSWRDPIAPSPRCLAVAWARCHGFRLPLNPAVLPFRYPL